MRVALYLRVSTSSQTVENQERELAAVAAARGWLIVETYRDEGISGAKGRDRRPGFDRLWKDAARRKFDVVAAWSVDRLGRSLADVATFMVDLKGYGVGLYLHAQAVDKRRGTALFDWCATACPVLLMTTLCAQTLTRS